MEQLDEVIRNRIQDKLNVAFRPDPVVQETPVAPTQNPVDANDILTTEEEMLAFMIVKAIAARHVDVSRVTIRDSKSYCSIFVDDNNRKPVCRFYFNGKSVKHLCLFDAAKVEEKRQISSLNDIFRFSDKIEAAVKAYS